jgi:hypothetical protein
MLDLNTIFDPDRKVSTESPVPAIGPDDLPADWHLLWDERAAIMEYDGGMPREQAEFLALADVLRAMELPGGNLQK